MIKKRWVLLIGIFTFSFLIGIAFSSVYFLPLKEGKIASIQLKIKQVVSRILLPFRPLNSVELVSDIPQYQLTFADKSSRQKLEQYLIKYNFWEENAIYNRSEVEGLTTATSLVLHLTNEEQPRGKINDPDTVGSYNIKVETDGKVHLFIYIHKEFFEVDQLTRDRFVSAMAIYAAFNASIVSTKGLAASFSVTTPIEYYSPDAFDKEFNDLANNADPLILVKPKNSGNLFYKLKMALTNFKLISPVNACYSDGCCNGGGLVKRRVTQTQCIGGSNNGWTCISYANCPGCWDNNCSCPCRPYTYDCNYHTHYYNCHPHNCYYWCSWSCCKVSWHGYCLVWGSCSGWCSYTCYDTCSYSHYDTCTGWHTCHGSECSGCARSCPCETRTWCDNSWTHNSSQCYPHCQTGGDFCETSGTLCYWAPYCGDSRCNNNETCASCPGDCGSCCGNGACDNGEDCASCPGDCGACCGNGACDHGESCSSCSHDCGPCCTPYCGAPYCGQGDGCGGTCSNSSDVWSACNATSHTRTNPCRAAQTCTATITGNVFNSDTSSCAGAKDNLAAVDVTASLWNPPTPYPTPPAGCVFTSSTTSTGGASNNYTISNLCVPGVYQITWDSHDAYNDDEIGAACTSPLGATFGSSDAGAVRTVDFGLTARVDSWWQTEGSGNVYTAQNLASDIPSSCSHPQCEPQLITTSGSDDPGVAIYAGASVNLGAGTTSDTNWLINSLYNSKWYGYKLYYNQLNFSANSEADYDNLAELLNVAKPSTPPLSGTAYYATGNMTINTPWDVTSAEKIVFIVAGDLDIYQEITVDKGGFLAFFVSGAIHIHDTLDSEDDNPAIAGMYVADGDVTMGDGGNTKLIAEGTYVSWAGNVKIQRDLGNTRNKTIPAVTFRYRPDFLTSAPLFLIRPHFLWEEVAP